MREFEGGATRDTTEGKIHYKGYISPTALKLYGEYMERQRHTANGLRAPDNWKLGIPLDAYEDSMFRHMMEFQLITETRTRDEALDTACAIWFNIQGWIHEQLQVMAIQRQAREDDIAAKMQAELENANLGE